MQIPNKNINFAVERRLPPSHLSIKASFSAFGLSSVIAPKSAKRTSAKDMKTQILDKQYYLISEKEIKKSSPARVTYARAKYFTHTSELPKSEVLSIPAVFQM